jgi:uncharacterized protein YbjQ (UPF0145 family)
MEEPEVAPFSLPEWGTGGAPSLNLAPEADQMATPTGSQGWAVAEDGISVWRTVVTTTEQVAGFGVAAYLGPVWGEAVTASAGDGLELRLGQARQRATDLMVEQACGRGAHAVVGVRFQVTAVGLSAVVSATGTAITLSPGG